MDNCLIALRLYERLIERILLTCTVLWTCSPGNRKLRTKKYFICRVGGFWLCCTSLHIDRLRVHDLNALFFLESRINFKPQSRHWARSALPLPSRHRPTLPRLLLQSRESSTGQRLGSATAAAAVRSWLALQWSSEGTRSIFSRAGTFCTTTGAGRHSIGGKRFWFPKILTGWCCATLCASALQSESRWSMAQCRAAPASHRRAEQGWQVLQEPCCYPPSLHCISWLWEAISFASFALGVYTQVLAAGAVRRGTGGPNQFQKVLLQGTAQPIRGWLSVQLDRRFGTGKMLPACRKGVRSCSMSREHLALKQNIPEGTAWERK